MEEIREGYKKTEVGVIPKDWEVKRLEEVAGVIAGQSPASESYNKEEVGIPFLQGKTEFGRRYPNINNYCSEPLKIAEKNDILISVRAPVGEVNIADRDICIGRGLAAIRALDNIRVDYTFYSLLGAKNRIESKGQGSTFTAISTIELRKIPIPLPPLEEQKKIADILSSVDGHIEGIEAILEDYKLLKKGMMQELLTNGIGHSEFKDSEVGRIPKSWEVIDFVDCLEDFIDYRGRTPKKLKMEWAEDGIMALSALNVKMGSIDFSIPTKYGTEELYEKWMTKGDLEKGDILMTMEAPVGNIALIPDNKKYILSQRVVALKTKSKLESVYLYYYLTSERFQNFLNINATGSTAKGISQKNLKEANVPLPPLEEQKKIADILSSIDNSIEGYEKELEGYRELKKGLMQVLLTGEKRVI